MSNAALLNRFYTAFAALDADTMQACYTEDARFDDPVFSLSGTDEIGAMWKMLCHAAWSSDPGRDVWRLEFGGIVADEVQGIAHWEPHYVFGATGRKVHNVIDSTFEFRGGRIAAQRDDFDFWRWSRQALGPVGLLLGWTPLLRRRVRDQAEAKLLGWRRMTEKVAVRATDSGSQPQGRRR